MDLLPDSIIEYLTTVYCRDDVNVILEYGTGCSTEIAVENGNKIYSIDSNKDYLNRYETKINNKNLISIWCDIGETVSFGYPKTNDKFYNFVEYALKPWDICYDNNDIPDVIFIDGRFRVGCFLATCVMIKKDTTVLFDDYYNRPDYHVVESISKPTEYIDNRLTVFNIEPDLISSVELLRKHKWFYRKT